MKARILSTAVWVVCLVVILGAAAALGPFGSGR